MEERFEQICDNVELRIVWLAGGKKPRYSLKSISRQVPIILCFCLGCFDKSYILYITDI